MCTTLIMVHGSYFGEEVNMQIAHQRIIERLNRSGCDMHSGDIEIVCTDRAVEDSGLVHIDIIIGEEHNGLAIKRAANKVFWRMFSRRKIKVHIELCIRLAWRKQEDPVPLHDAEASAPNAWSA